ncbi:MAG: nucleotidyltransferase domain-containing protein [Planctomycetes bacterium]|nr:nucleotidyltransferase domain-containing protein [Planctomycetota bacterium]
MRAARPEVVRIGYFGSYARGDYVPASDLDVVVEVRESPHARWFDRPADFPHPSEVPLGVDLFIYTTEDIARMEREGSGWWRRVVSEVAWV